MDTVLQRIRSAVDRDGECLSLQDVFVYLTKNKILEDMHDAVPMLKLYNFDLPLEEQSDDLFFYLLHNAHHDS